jgi:transmembrane sensor
MEKEEKDIRFVARFYQEGRLNTTQAWEKLKIDKRENKYGLWYKLTPQSA